MSPTTRKAAPIVADDADDRFPFTYRCPARLRRRLDFARFKLQEPSRTSLVTKAIEHYLDAKNIRVPRHDIAASPGT